MNMLKEKIKRGEKLRGTLLNMGDVVVCDVLSRVGFDFLWIDFEHSALTYEQLLTHVTLSKANGTPVLVRVPQHDFTATKKVLDMGADGIIFPMVQSAKEADELIKATLYPPDGNRGFGPMGATQYGALDAEQYVVDANRDICRFIQVECKALIDELDTVMENEFIDGYIFGPNDLSGSIHQFLDVYGEGTTALMQTATQKLQSRNKYIGVATGSPEEKVIAHWCGMGVPMITAGGDFTFLLQGAKKMLDAMKKVQGVQDDE